MADNPAPPARNSELLVDLQPPPPPLSIAGSNSNMPFTPRSSTFPDDLSDDDQAYNPTPISSPGGPRYEDLPPSYDEAQQQALDDARAGRTPPSLLDLEVHRMVLTDGPAPPPPAQRTSLLDDPNAYEFEPENRSNARGLGTSVPVQQVGGTERIPVGIPDPTGALLTRALEFTRHEPDSDARFASRLTRVVAIPQQGTPELTSVDGRECGRRRRGRGRRERGRRRDSHHMPGQWPDSSAENLPAFHEEPAQFMRAYAKALHSHSIRPAEFTEFLDGLNALCAATGITATELNDSLDERASLVQNYIASTNESFFGPRGLKVSLKSLSSLVSSLQIPEVRGQRAGAIASALDEKSTNEQRAGALYPWVEKLEMNVPASSSQMLVLREMSERLYLQTHPRSIRSQTAGVISNGAAPGTLEKEPEAEDPDHSIPNEAPGPIPGAFPFGPGKGPFGAIGNGPFGKPGNGPFGAPGNTPFGQPGNGPFGRPGNGPGRWGHWTQNQGNRGRWGNHGGCGERGGPGRGWGGNRCGSGSNPTTAPAFPRPGETNNWAAWGESLGKWGEEFGKHMQQWGEQFGKNAEEWGHGIERSVSGSAGPNAGPSMQQSGVHRDAKFEETEKNSKIDHHDYDDDDDTSSLSSSSSSDSSDSDSDSDSEPEPSYPDPHAIFLNRVREINLAAEASTAKGKKSPSVISQERSLAIEKAAADKTALELKIEQKREKWARKKSLRQQKREIKAEAIRLKKEMTELGVDRKEVKKEYRSLKWQKMKEHREAKREARREWKAKRGERREEIRKLKKGKSDMKKGLLTEKEREERMTWVVIENLAA